jgi:hypothetical protein
MPRLPTLHSYVKA